MTPNPEVFANLVYLSLKNTPAIASKSGQFLPVVEKLKVSGLRCGKTWKKDRVERLHGMVNEAWKDLIAQGARVTVEE